MCCCVTFASLWIMAIKLFSTRRFPQFQGAIFLILVLFEIVIVTFKSFRPFTLSFLGSMYRGEPPKGLPNLGFNLFYFIFFGRAFGLVLTPVFLGYGHFLHLNITHNLFSFKKKNYVILIIYNPIKCNSLFKL